MTKIIKLKDKSNTIQITPKEALKEALVSDFKAEKVLIILCNDRGGYEFWQGGGMTLADMVWHAKKFITAIMEGRVIDK